MAALPIIDEIAKLFLVFLFVVELGYGTFGAILADVLATTIGVFVLLPYAVPFVRNILSVSSAKSSELWAIFRTYGKWAIASRYLDDIRRSIRPWIVKVFLGTEAVAIYALAESLVAQVTALAPLSAVLAPLLPRELSNRERVRNLLIVGIKYGTPLFAIITISSLIVVPALVETLFPAYIQSIDLFMIMAISVIVAAIAGLLTSILYAERQQRMQFFITLSTMIFMAIVGIVCVRTFGLIGIAYEFLATLVFYNCARLIFVLHKYPELRFKPSELFSWSEKDRLFIGLLKTSVLERLRLVFSREAS